jgi:hypothetical protein
MRKRGTYGLIMRAREKDMELPNLGDVARVVVMLYFSKIQEMYN